MIVDQLEAIATGVIPKARVFPSGPRDLARTVVVEVWR